MNGGVKAGRGKGGSGCITGCGGVGGGNAARGDIGSGGGGGSAVGLGGGEAGDEGGGAAVCISKLSPRKRGTASSLESEQVASPPPVHGKRTL